MADAFQLGVVLTLKDLLSNKLAGLNSHWDELKKKLGETDEAVKRVDAGFAKLASGANKLGAGIAIGFALKPAIDEARAFEKEISMTAAIAKVSAQELDGLKEAAIEAGMATKFSPTEAMAGLTALASAGIQGADNLKKGLIPALDLAAASAGKLSVDNAAADMAASMTSFDASGSKVADVFVNMANIASYRVEEIGAAWRGVNLAASAANQSMETTGAVMAAMKNNGATVIESGEGVRMALTALKAPSIQAKQAMESLGVSAYDKNSGKFRNLIDIFEDLQNATNGMAEADRNAILQKILHEGGIKAFQATTKIGIDNVRGYATSIGQTGTSHDFAATQIDNFDGAVQILQGNIQTLKVLLGQGLMPALKMIFQGFSFVLSPIIEFLKTHPRFTQFIGVLTALTAVILTLAGAVQMANGAWMVLTVWTKRNLVLTGLTTIATKAATLAKTLWAVAMALATKAQIALNVAMSANPIGLIVLGVTLLVGVIAAAVYWFDEWTAWVRRVWEENTLLIGVITLLTLPITGLLVGAALLIAHWKDVVAVLQEFGGWVMSVWESLIGFKQEHELLFGVLSLLGGPITVIIYGLISLVQYWEQITNAIGNAIAKVKDFFSIKEDPNKVIQSGMDSNIKKLMDERQKAIDKGHDAKTSLTVKGLDQQIAGYSKQRESFKNNLKGQESYNSEMEKLKKEDAKITSNLKSAKTDDERGDLFSSQQANRNRIKELEKDKTKIYTAGGMEQLKAIQEKERKEKEETEKAKKGRLKDYNKQKKEIEKAKNEKAKKGTVEYDYIMPFDEEQLSLDKRLFAIKRAENDLKRQYLGRKGELEKSQDWKKLQSEKSGFQEYQGMVKELKEEQDFIVKQIKNTTDPKEIEGHKKDLETIQGKLNALQKDKEKFLKGGQVELKAKTVSEYFSNMKEDYASNKMGAWELVGKSAFGMFGTLFGKTSEDTNKPNSEKSFWNSSIYWLKNIAEKLKNPTIAEKAGTEKLKESVGVSAGASAGVINMTPQEAFNIAMAKEAGQIVDPALYNRAVEILGGKPPTPSSPSPSPVKSGSSGEAKTGNSNVNVSVVLMDKIMDVLGIKVKEEAGNH